MTKRVYAGSVAIGGGAPVTVQSMTNTETENLEANARDKLRRKNLDWIIANFVSDGFGNDTNRVIIFNRNDEKFPLALEEKSTLAKKIIELIL